jgi:hypothetical protein
MWAVGVSGASCGSRVASGEREIQGQDQELTGECPSPHELVPTRFLFCEEVVEGFYGGEFVLFYVEDGVELGYVENVLNFLGEA